MNTILTILKEPFVELPEGTVVNKQLRPVIWVGVGLLLARAL